MTDTVIQTDRLTRYFGTKCALRDLSLEVPRGSVFGFLGRNGSGKTTTIRLMLGLIEPTRGGATLMGHDSAQLPDEVRAKIGYMPEGHPVYGWMKAREAGRFQRDSYRKWNDKLFNAILDHFRIAPNDKAKHLSRGMRAGLCLALTLATEPELLILDDPALGLDPVARHAFLESMVYVTREKRCTIFFSSHLLSDVERVADRIAVLDHNVLKACCSIETFRQQVRQVVLRFEGEPPPPPEVPGLLHSVRLGNELKLTLVNANGEVDEAMRQVGASSIEPVPLGLEEAFLAYLSDRGEKTSFFEKVGAER
jgi:ABC-2 type transport system ATP-binding protein